MESFDSTLAIPEILKRTQPPAQFALFDNGHLLINLGEKTMTLTPEDLRRLDRFMNTFGEQR